jgi:hypothetical protein
VRVSRRTYRLLHWIGFAAPLAFGCLVLLGPWADEPLFQFAALAAFLSAAIGAADFVRAWRETERRDD